MKVSKWIPLIFVIAISFTFLIWYFGIGGFVAGIFETLLLLVLANPLETMSITASAFKKLRGVHFFFEKYAVEKRLESTIGLCSKKINEDGVEILPHGIDIKWEDIKDKEAFLKEDKIVVCFEPSQNEARNLARATMLYTSADLIRESQRFIDHSVLKSACFTVARKMLMMDRRLDAFKCLNEEFLEPEVARFPLIMGYLNVMEKLDSEGNFTRVLMRELSELGAKLSSVLSNPKAEKETLSLMKTMERLSEKEKGIDISPNHREEIIDFGIMLNAREGVIDPTPYIKYAKRCWDEGLPKLYVLAQGKKINLAMAAVLGIKTDGTYRVETEKKFWIPERKGRFEGYIAVLSRISK